MYRSLFTISLIVIVPVLGSTRNLLRVPDERHTSINKRCFDATFMRIICVCAEQALWFCLFIWLLAGGVYAVYLLSSYKHFPSIVECFVFLGKLFRPFNIGAGGSACSQLNGDDWFFFLFLFFWLTNIICFCDFYGRSVGQVFWAQQFFSFFLTIFGNKFWAFFFILIASLGQTLERNINFGLLTIDWRKSSFDKAAVVVVY